MNSSNIISEPLDESIDSYLKQIFYKSSLIEVFKKDVWIAGGFSRLIGHCHFNLITESLSSSIYEYIYKAKGDIDLFTTSSENFKYCSSYMMHTSNKQNSNNYLDPSFENIFAKNYFLKFGLIDNSSKVDYPSILVQFVNKFFFKKIEDCLNSFDFTNCKYGLKYKEDKFYIYYDPSALFFDKRKELNIEHSRSPLLAKRIIKYLKEKDLIGVYDSDCNKKILKEFYYKAATNNWDNIYTENMEKSNFSITNLGILTLERTIPISKEDLLLFLGKAEIANFEKESNSSYGIYVDIEYCDWATKLISER